MENGGANADEGGGEQERVVGRCEQRLVRRCGEVLAAAPELRQPEAVEVRLVADDEVVDEGIPLRDVDAEHEKVLLWVHGSSGDVRDPIQPSRG